MFEVFQCVSTKTIVDVFLSLGDDITAGNQTLHWMSLSDMQNLTHGFPFEWVL